MLKKIGKWLDWFGIILGIILTIATFSLQIHLIYKIYQLGLYSILEFQLIKDLKEVKDNEK